MKRQRDSVVRAMTDDGGLRVVAAVTHDTVQGVVSAQGVRDNTAALLGDNLNYGLGRFIGPRAFSGRVPLLNPRSRFHVALRVDYPNDFDRRMARREEIVSAIRAHQVVVIAGETGSGKTTQIPKMCLAAGRGMQGRIACTQPRRVAALSISRRVAEELGVNWGREVGSKVRFDDRTSPATVIKFLTDGMLLAEVQGDRLLREYDTVIIDEAHERSLNIDFLLGHLRQLRFRRPELKIIITSATIDTAAFSAAFDDAPVVLVEGRTFPVEVIYAPLDELGRDYAENDENEDQEDRAAVASARAAGANERSRSI